MKKIILYHTFFRPQENGHGGEKRTAQIFEILTRKNISKISYQMHEGKITIPSFLSSFRLVISMFHWFNLKSMFYYCIALSKNIVDFKSFLSKDIKTFIYESTGEFFTFMPFLAKRNKKKIIALPHNLESLVANSISHPLKNKAPKGFEREIKNFRLCDYVFTISREETWLLRLWGINAFYLPYYPTNDLKVKLLDLRTRREQYKENKTFLMLGSSLNKPTELGMLKIIQYFALPNMRKYNLMICGYGTEKLANKIESSNITLLGSVTNEKLDELIVHSKALIISQPPTTGALTRIIESLIAGLPVIADENSSRNYYGTDGLYVYTDFHSINTILQQDLSCPKIPKEPDYTQFLQSIIL